MTTVAIHQPQYLPWIPYFDKADQADVFVYLDTAQYQKNGVQNRNQIQTAAGPMWLTVPVQAALGDRILEVRVADQKWQRKHASSLEQNYARAAHRQRLDGLLGFYSHTWELLVDVNIATSEWLFGELGIQSRRVRASSLGTLSGTKDDLVLAICRALGASRYLSGTGARAYQNPAKFAAAGISLAYQRFRVAAYHQCHDTAGFSPQLSAVDLVLNEGPRAGELMRQGRRAPEDAA